MKREFIKIKETGIRLSTIKKYKPSRDGKTMYLYYNTSRTKVEVEPFEFKSKKEANSILTELDILLEDYFVMIADTRIRMSTIKKYKPMNGVKINIHYSCSVGKLVVETFTFKNSSDRDAKLQDLDVKFGIIF